MAADVVNLGMVAVEPKPEGDLLLLALSKPGPMECRRQGDEGTAHLPGRFAHGQCRRYRISALRSREDQAGDLKLDIDDHPQSVPPSAAAGLYAKDDASLPTPCCRYGLVHEVRRPIAAPKFLPSRPMLSTPRPASVVTLKASCAVIWAQVVTASAIAAAAAAVSALSGPVKLARCIASLRRFGRSFRNCSTVATIFRSAGDCPNATRSHPVRVSAVRHIGVVDRSIPRAPALEPSARSR